jgi:3-hydroxyisobutyrate dehydrogenase-like beta-hydroxyacid dehydrogenase
MALKVGIIGLGTMGSQAAARLEELGFDLVVYARNPEKMAAVPTATAAHSVADLANRSDVILSFVFDSSQLEEVALGKGGIIGAARQGTIFISMSTVSPVTTRKIADAFAPNGVDVVGACMNGGPPVLRAGKLELVVGAKDEVLEKCRPVLEALGRISHMGDVGAGEMAKIVNQLILANCITANAEALVLGVKFGLDPDKLVDCVIDGVGSNHAMRKHYKQHVLKGDFQENLSSVDLMRKDLSLGFDVADALKVPLVLSRVTDQLYQGARAAGRTENYHPVVVTVLEDLCGVKIRSKALGAPDDSAPLHR